MKAISKIILALSVVWLIMSAIIQVDARAGWGHSSRWSSSSSHSSSSSRSSSSSSSFGTTGISSNSTWSIGPGTVTILIIAFTIFIIMNIRKWKKGMEIIDDESYDSVSVQPDLPRPIPNLSEKITTLQSKDPWFNEQMFEDHASTTFFKVQEAWCKCDMNIARAFVTDSVIRRFNIQLEEYRENKTHNKLEGLALNKVDMLDIVTDANMERIDVILTATAKDYIVDAEGKYVSGNNSSFATWDEKWSFVRTAGVKTDANKSVFSEKCPNCGAPLKVSNTGECEYCRSNITTGAFDWVLSEITQLNV